MKKNEIMEKKKLSDGSYLFKIYNPEVAKNSYAGNFVIVIAKDGSERIPLTIMEYTDEWISIVIQPIGFSTKEICFLEEKDCFSGIMGPLGKKIENKKYGTILFVAGGIGIAPVIPQMMEFKKTDNKIILIHGARDGEHIILEKESKKYTDNYIICTDDGSMGKKGLVTNAMKELIESGEKIDHIVTIGPLIMMKFVSDLSKNYSIPTTASLNTIMLDGTGMCGSCRVEYDGEVKFACVDGPDMDAHKINFDVLLRRNARFKSLELVNGEKK
ncbi:MAG: sulfide/dihydroorotate dehydrogenase-like FAD/NAD-binding protein [Candidatus Muirbacterium halophilum]|nr:sulfide/dihydroorotate dehydrogenase-like FAD/NAD-binding protein [Candidatus Muirbacterium halophilum]MCK9475279.1 sulfide/dihydroorotate dehydrogenase-like FAD/NAD-binding protein [Candidatus Muirbacterium halophilum]